MQLRSVVALVGLALGTSAMAQDAIAVKQLAGPPEEFAQMRAADPIDAAIHSKSALIPITLKRDKSGGLSWQGQLPADAAGLRFLVLSSGDLSVDLAAPGSRGYAPALALARTAQSTRFGLENTNFPADLYEVDSAEAGIWGLRVRGDAASKPEAFLLIEGSSDTQLLSYQTDLNTLVGEEVHFAASLTGDPAQGVRVGTQAGQVLAANLRVTAPSGAVAEYSMRDLGADGAFDGSFVAREVGQYQVQVSVSGRDVAGNELVRSAEHLVPVVASTVRLSGASASLLDKGQDRFSVRVPVQVDRAATHFRAFGEVWGVDGAGAEVAVAWVGGMVEPKDGAIEFGLDARWISRAAAKAPFTLHHLRIEDPNNYVSMVEDATLSIAGAPAASGKKAGFVAIDDSMRMGLSPAPLTAAKGVGRRLLLVHGYCSGGVWPGAQFANSSSFLDVNQNRTHDEFARRIQTFGNTWNSFGVVAHSQGGAAALHLLTYYWSGLDRATGSRLIQSVGTPYQGTNLAGILASLGGWFGVGCSSNNDLSYSGATAWLRGIPTSSRARVNYYTTSFRTTNWWTNDFCNFATDLVLSDPEDGTTEQAKGQLSGAVNRGHTTGQCHTAGMRDPAQFLDSGRNSVMSSNAAR